MTQADVIARVQKLLALSKSDNEHEAALAGRRATEMLAKHNLSMDALDTSGRPEDDGEKPDEFRVDENGTSAWRGTLAQGLARVYGCDSFRRGNAWGKEKAGYYMVGRPKNVQTVKYLYTWLAKEIERLAFNRRGSGKAWIHAYKIGAAQTIVNEVAAAFRDTVQTARAEAVNNSTALVVVNEGAERYAIRRAEAGAWMKATFGRLKTTSRTMRSRDGYATGRRDGAGVYGGGHSRIGGGNKRIG